MMRASIIILLSVGLLAPTAQSAEVEFVTCDNGLRCFRPPCPSRDSVLLPSHRRLARTAPDLSRLGEAQHKQLLLGNTGQGSALYAGTVVLAGTLEEGPPTRLVASRIVRPATKAESQLCRRR
ncbi:hypothetical protein [Bosea sp. (in: a-proteobacteria)]|jgi:hypothetical protein|uniref:hypothetical protein n=1 Tax=Bosea sp. (in: a-proteobacteria) TaxID=1871050 RepID=UPI002DDCB405|nr:hypothetical protein [Bosea sp. (in: a-proteobacteria)]HEV2513453.1 hypothetical protein [Bosea sp. (in: a-proteobacteria)]